MADRSIEDYLAVIEFEKKFCQNKKSIFKIIFQQLLKLSKLLKVRFKAFWRNIKKGE